jgi:hypothetical protein
VRVTETIVNAVPNQPVPDPLGHWYAHGIPDKTPAFPSIASIQDGRKRPANWEPLEQLGPFDRRDKNGAAPGEPNRRWSWDAEARPWLQRRHRIDRPTETTIALRPVEALGVIAIGVAHGLPRILPQQNGTRVPRLGCNQEYPSPPLRQSERGGIDNAVRPRPAQRLKAGRDLVYRAPTVQLQHERDIFQYQPGWLMGTPSEQVENGRDEAGFGSADTFRWTSLAQVLAGEARRDHVALWQRREMPHVRYEFCIWEVSTKNTAS